MSPRDYIGGQTNRRPVLLVEGHALSLVVDSEMFLFQLLMLMSGRLIIVAVVQLNQTLDT